MHRLAIIALLPAAASALPQAASGARTAPAILEAECLSCHGEAAASGLDLRTRESALRGGSRGPAIAPGRPEESLLYRMLEGIRGQGRELRMPMGKSALDAAGIARIASWIRGGAAWPEHPLGQGGQWWALQPAAAVEPGIDKPNPIDGFLAARLRVRGLEPAPEADPRTLVRRVWFDLHGLPPPSEAVEAFQADPSREAYAKLIDDLLASPRYGERWGRYWLDVVRYADTGGFETDIYFPNAWRYRDYVIRSFNDDKPYDRFVREQIAGDEIWPDDIELRGGYRIPQEKLEHLEARIGTGMYTIGPVYHEAALDGRQLRYEWLVDAVDTTGEAFLGLTLGCARCHDHKFDPLTQRDYHRMMAVFAGSEPKEIPVVHKMSQLGFYSGYPRLLKVEEYKAAVKRIDAAARRRLVKQVEARFSAQVLQAYRVPRGERTAEQREQAAGVEAALTEAGLKENAAGLAARLEYTPQERDDRERLLYELGKAALAAKFSVASASVLGHAEVRYPVHMTSRGDYRAAGERVAAGFPAVFTGGREQAATSEPASGPFAPQRRKALAEWLASPDHPLTARVMVNRIWQGHFGRGLVAAANDFGRQAEPPTHPALLDWLAVRFVEDGWSVKKLHRRIMLSEAYRRSSLPVAANAAVDPQNRLLWRMNRRRLDAETLRDSILAAAGKLNLKMGGRPVVPPLSADEMQGIWSSDQWPVSLDPAEHNRRSVYLYVKRSFPYPMFTTFDAPDTSTSCARRSVTTVAPQALTLLNSGFVREQARALAGRAQDPRRLWKLTLGRGPSPQESERTADLAPEHLALMLLNLNEFLYID